MANAKHLLAPCTPTIEFENHINLSEPGDCRRCGAGETTLVFSRKASEEVEHSLEHEIKSQQPGGSSSCSRLEVKTLVMMAMQE